MRLINTGTGLFEEFIGRNIPKYAILSHTWEEEKVSFSDMQKDGHQAKKGFEKIRMTCKLAADAGIQYAWVDTCCIDKSSSAELTEAINSMYRWYQRSAICYAYLSDLSPSGSMYAALPSCRWFTRGWTLQELIAPSEIRFFNRSWIDRGSKESLCTKLSEITGIDAKVLRHEVPLASIAVAQRMSWAAKRETTRIEDRSYSLLGLFGVHMPMIYGEEGRAFRRLQEEIIKSTVDMSIFAWKMPEHTKPLDYPGTQYVCGLLASSPDDFWDCGIITRAPNTNINEFSLSNKGVKSHARREKIGALGGSSSLPLECASNARGLPFHLPFTMWAKITRCGFDLFVRRDPWSLGIGVAASSGTEIQPQTEYFLSELPDMSVGDSGPQYCLKAPFLAARRYSVLQLQFPAQQIDAFIDYLYAWPKGQWNEEDFLFFVPSRYDWGSCGVLFGVRWKNRVDLHYTLFTPGMINLEFRTADCFQFTIADASVFNLPDPRLLGQTDLEIKIKELGLPRTTQVVTEIPNTGLVAVLSAEHSIARDKNVCQELFMRIQFHFEVVEIGKAPTPVDLGWNGRMAR
ncbi:heterokaryon incompatibility protein-domain-containing protein [Schizothecium vesticola]|uniref:Heterokaryon incompatibility protein-domain-containing protein n=1 Tax=Schizothecium vesticola TaxID=314040 RepID=A0AA40K8L1_9PEZI|nr:heterokaryon incompatibility protein-domain-containing protein [Schizothecium vesticola]